VSALAVQRIRRKGVLAPVARDLLLVPVPQRHAGKREVLIVLAVFAGLAVFFTGSLLVPRSALGDETVSVQDEPKPPEPAKPLPPRPPEPPPETPKDMTPPPADPNPQPQASPDPPPPQFGLPDGSFADNGSFAVATGNTVMKTPEAVVKPPPVAKSLPPAPAPLTRPPDELTPVVPAYPAWAEEQGVTAVVVAQVIIDASGTVTDVVIVRSGGKDFDRAARAALATAKYRPYIKDGKAVPAVFERRFDFRLD